jgi:hypothetical protein
MMRLSRFRHPTIAILLMVLAAVIAATAGVSAATQPALASGALGLSRAQIEAMWGAATEPVEMPGRPMYDATYAYGSQAAMTYVSYREYNGEQLAVYVEYTWFGDGATQGVASATIEGLLPSDAALTELYVAPATPEGPITLLVYRYISEALGEAHHGVLAPEILVIQQEVWNDAAGSAAVSSFSLMIRERTQLTG